MVTVVPPVVEPMKGETDVMVGGSASNVNVVLDVAVPPGVVTDTFTFSGDCASVIAVMA